MSAHEYTWVEEKLPAGDPLAPGYRWRWKCSCGSKGMWTYQSPNVPEYGWQRHLERVTKR